PGQRFQEGPDVLLALAFDRMQDSARIQIGDHGHIMMALFQAELVNADDLHFVERDFAIKELQPFLVDVLDQVPAYSKEFGDRPDRPEFKQVEHSKRKRPNKAVSPDHKWKRWPPESRTLTALHTVK